MTKTFRILHWICRLVMAGIFLYTGYVKLGLIQIGPIHFGDPMNRLFFGQAISGYQLVPENLVPFIAQWFPWLEIILGVLLLIGWKIRYVAGAATALMLFFTVILTITYLRGIDANCGCFDFNSKISPLTILRDSIILIPALYLLFESMFLSRANAKGK